MTVPKLRFPEFKDALEWETKRLGELLLSHPDYGVNAPSVPYSEDLPAYLRITDISDEGYFLSDKKTSVAIKVTDENYLDEGDIVLARTGASVGKSYEYRKEDGKLVFAGFLIRIKPDKQKLNSTFLFNFISTNQYWNWVGIISARSGQPGINGNEYANLLVPVPQNTRGSGGLSEQQKIADCLTSLDQLITAQKQKLESLEVHKKGLMQQLFPSDGETVPKLRFLEFRDALEWEEKRLNELFEFRNGLNADKERYGKGHKYISVMDIISGKPITYNSIINSVEITKKELDSFIVKYGDILFQRSSETQEEAGQANVYLDKEKPAIFGGFVIRGKKILEYIPLFINALLASMRVRREIISKSAGSTRYNIGQETLSVIVVLVPDLKEQQKIADCLTSLNELITAQKQKLETLKTHKKGLMQQLFPTTLEERE